MFTEGVGESYREYFSEGSNPGFVVGGWLAVEAETTGDLGRQTSQGHSEWQHGKTHSHGPHRGHFYPTPHAVLYHTTKGKSLGTPAGMHYFLKRS